MKNVTKIDQVDLSIFKKMRVAAYCRVSTDSNEQELSLDTQKNHYESYIKANSEWEYAGIYYDDGISGTKTTKRDSLLRLVEDCEKGLISDDELHKISEKNRLIFSPYLSEIYQ